MYHRELLILLSSILGLSLSIDLGNLSAVKEVPSKEPFVVAENATIGTSVFKLHDICDVSCSNFSITSGNMNKRFAVDSTGRTVYVYGYLDYEFERKYVLTLIVNYALSNSSRIYREVYITVEDVSNWPPVYNESCASVEKDTDVPVDYPYPITLWFTPPHTQHKMYFESDGDHLAEVDLMNSICQIELFRLVKPELKNFLQYSDFDCRKDNMATSKFYKDIDEISSHVGRSLDIYDRDRFIMEFDVTVDDAIISDEGIHCLVTLQNGYQSTEWGKRIQEMLPDKTSFSITAGIDVIGCPDGKYGGRCQYDCICQNGATCHFFNGACKCSPGWRGVACDITMQRVEIVPHGTLRTEIGEVIEVTCNLHNLDETNLYNATWLYEDNDSDRWPVESGGVLHIYTRRFKTVIEIFRIQDKHAGIYICLATDINGHEYRDEITIIVEGCTDGFWGDKCDRTCDCQNGGNCSRSSGCICQLGWAGTNCSQDIQPPLFTFCPSNISQTAMTYRSHIKVTWPLPGVFDNSGLLNMTSNFDPGDVFSVGANLVIYKAKDLHGNEAECGFYVTVDNSSMITKTTIVSCLLATLLVIIGLIAVIIYFCRHRRKILLKYTLMNGQCDGKDIGKEKEYDAFVAYRGNTEEETFVYKTLIPKLEKKYGFKLNVHGKDFMPGKAIATNILDAVTNSRCTILLLSPNFVKSEWCIYELDQAYYEMIGRKHKLIPIMFDDITHTPDLPVIVKTIIDSISYIEWPRHGGEREKDKFWKRLIDAIPKKQHRLHKGFLHALNIFKQQKLCCTTVKYTPLTTDEEVHIQIDNTFA